MFRLARGLSLSPFRREWLVKDVVADLISLEELDETLNARRISLVFAELKDPVRGKIERYGLTRTIDPDHFFPTVEAAVTAFRAGTGADWTPAVQPEADPTTANPTART